jgi:hypothetical protein
MKPSLFHGPIFLLLSGLTTLAAWAQPLVPMRVFFSLETDKTKNPQGTDAD